VGVLPQVAPELSSFLLYRFEINIRASSVLGIVGAGGNAGAVLGGFWFKSASIDWSTALFLLGVTVTAASFASFLVTFSPETESEIRQQTETAVVGSRSAVEMA